MQKTYICHDVEETIALGEKIGSRLRGGETIELMSDLGGGKTTFVRGLARGFGSADSAASPSFTISYVYKRDDGKEMHHFDFYRLQDAGIVGNELREVEGDENAVVVVEWGDIVHNVLPADRIKIHIKAIDEGIRQFEVTYIERFNSIFQ
jgi:tRNA threonylcarbamoyladenosine biosynthesis protein TsaE